MFHSLTPMALTVLTAGNKGGGGAPGGKVDLNGSWKKFWDTLTANLGGSGFFTVLAIVGMLMVVGAFIGYLMKRRNGGGGGMQAGTPIFWALIIGILFMAPQVLIPGALKVLDVIANTIIGFINML